MIARAGDSPTTPAIVDEGVNGLLEHPFLITYDNLRGTEIEKPPQPIVAIDHAPIKIVEIRGGKSSPIQLNHRTKVRGEYREHG
jgi:hypothetical protein